MTNSSSNEPAEYDESLHSLLPHRAPMLVLEKMLYVDNESSASLALVNSNSLFYIAGQGIPAWTGIEHMGQTAALIAGYQQQQGNLPSHTGFLLGSRRFETSTAWFHNNAVLYVRCKELAIVGEGLANFECSISLFEQTTVSAMANKFHSDARAEFGLEQQVATATLTVFRKPNTQNENTLVTAI